jgi:hypothetical protein
MGRASPHNRFALNQTQPIRQSAEQVKIQSNTDSMIGHHQQQSMAEVNNTDIKASLQ